MNIERVTLELPINLYEKLQALATEEQKDLVGCLTQLVADAYQRRGWLQDLTALRQQIQSEGDLQMFQTKEEVIIQMRQTRHEIFETEYAHLYR